MGGISGFKAYKAAGFMLVVFFLLFFPMRAEGQVVVSPKGIRVGMAQDIAGQEFSVLGAYRAVDRQSGKILADVLPGDRWEVRCPGGKLQLYRNGQPAASSGSVLGLEQVSSVVSVLRGDGSLKSIRQSDTVSVIIGGGSVTSVRIDSGVTMISGSGTNSIQGGGDLNLVSLVFSGQPRRYRGDMEFRAQGQGITVINELPLEEYLYGVLPREMPASWPAEAQKAQAVASRTFALANLGMYSSYGFDILATQMSQMYGGYDAESPNSTRAVNETGGQVVLNRGKPISAFFHSSSGGCTENAQDVWRENLEYIVSRPDPYDKNDKNYNWLVSYDMLQLADQLNSKKSLFNTAGATERLFWAVDGIGVLEKTSSGARVKRIGITGVDRDGQRLAVEIGNADAVRMALGLKSALFDIKEDRDISGKLVSVTFTGSGYGHGLGMSQYGACGMANQGYNYQDILKYYYNNCGIGPLSGVE